MRTFVFTLLAIAVAIGIHWGLGQLPYLGPGVMKVTTSILHLLLPVIATAGLAYAMRIWNWYVVFLAILSPFVSMALMIGFSLFVLNDNLL